MISSKTVLFFMVIVYSSFFVLATPVLELERTTIQPDEVLIGKLYTSGKFLDDITKADIIIKEGRKEVTVDYNLYRYNDEYYFYAIFPREGTFTIETPDILYELLGEVGSKKISQDITVVYTNNESDNPEQLLAIKPGVIYSFGNSASLSLFNRGSESLSISIGDESLSIAPYQGTSLNLNLYESLSFVNIDTYTTFSIPVIYLGAPVNTESNESIVIMTTKLAISKNSIEENVTANDTRSYTIEIANTGTENITGISIVSNVSKAIITTPYNLSPGTSGNINIDIFTGSTSRSEILTLSYLENESEFNISIPIILTIQEVTSTNNTQNVILTCSDYGGNICDGECIGNSNFTSDGYCCYGECKPFEIVEGNNSNNGASYGWMIGLLIFIAIAVIGYVILMKYKEANPEAPQKKLDTSKKKYENRMKGVVTRN